MKDQLHRSVNLIHTPKRIVSLVPSQTELLVDLGLEEAIVGITKFCVHPNHLLQHKTVVGGTKQVHLSKIKDLHPDLILCNKEENTIAMVEELEKLAPVHISDVNTFEDAIGLIEQYGLLFSKEQTAYRLINSIQEKRRELAAFIKDKPKKSVAYFIWKNPWMVAASETFINELLTESGFLNYFGSQQRYPEILLNAKLPESPDLVFLSSEPFPFKQEHKLIIQDYFPKATISIVDGEMFSWYGSRLLKAFDYFKTLHQHH
ncbi:ABC-type Fe3+-hydroxamate transport system substrate-binding protein [Gelidibacter sediminis]|uniref:ABC-type Fe3+-hydroxamate transport system substrate-binding protein n=1 Tax=Gelidibacter sediminis TaxID=1608710 RepID=A0A4R7Q594_9FLAO|nr:helical backbone metal receptor [Gelidibacter sediminis]TDU42707.1 ABC-type Fe3+-hydroxamate transport system substrate-binding protein [Gelidibacter sediminis]